MSTFFNVYREGQLVRSDLVLSVRMYSPMSDTDRIAHAEMLAAEAGEGSWVSVFDGLRLVADHIGAKPEAPHGSERHMQVKHFDGSACDCFTNAEPLDAALPIGTRVEIAPHHDLWMRGARFGAITRYSNDGQYAYVKLDNLGSDRKFYASDVEAI